MIGDHTNAKSFRGSSMSEWQCAIRIPSPVSYSHSPLCKILMSLEGEEGVRYSDMLLYMMSLLYWKSGMKEWIFGHVFVDDFYWMRITWNDRSFRSCVFLSNWQLVPPGFSIWMQYPSTSAIQASHLSVHNWSSHACLCYARLSLSCSLLNIWRQSLK